MAMKRSSFLKSLLAIPVAVKALANVEANQNHIQEEEYGTKELLGQYVIIDKKRYDIAQLTKNSIVDYEVLLYSWQIGAVDLYNVWEKCRSITFVHDGYTMECYITNMSVGSTIELTLVADGEITKL